MNAVQLIASAARSIEAAQPLIPDAHTVGEIEEIIAAAVTRGHFTPEEDVRIKDTFHDYLTARSVIWHAIDDLRPLATGQQGRDAAVQVRAFVVAFAGACVLVRAGRAIVARIASDPVVRRKLDEPGPERGIPRKQLTKLYRALTSPVHAWHLQWAKEYASTHRAKIRELSADPALAHCCGLLDECEGALDIAVRQYLWGRLRFRWHAARRKGASAFQRAMFGLFAVSGRAIANARSPWYRKRINETVRRKLAAILRPGDILITRHHDAMSNLFLPGYWPHAALHVGTVEERNALAVEIDDARARRWVDPVRVLEARKDGVLFRALDDTLAVDAVVVLRPQLDADQMRDGLTRAIAHEGKLYDFSFDFFRSDRLVCTELVYRAFDGLGATALELTPRAGRPTLSAEDLLDAAVAGRGFDPVAIFGTPDTRRRVVIGDAVRELLIRSYR